MSKRLSISGNSPASKKLTVGLPSSKGDGDSQEEFEFSHLTRAIFEQDSDDINSSPLNANLLNFDSFSSTPPQFEDILGENVAKNGIRAVADVILRHENLKKEILDLLLKESHDNFKASLKSSQLCASKNDREFLLSISPKSLCEDFHQLSPLAFSLVTKGLLGIINTNDVFDSQHNLNNIAFILGTAGKAINRKATSYGYLLTNAVRDGGLREDSIKILPMLIHPRTSQIYDKDVLSKNWRQPLEELLAAEKDHFIKLDKALRYVVTNEKIHRT